MFHFKLHNILPIQKQTYCIHNTETLSMISKLSSFLLFWSLSFSHLLNKEKRWQTENANKENPQQKTQITLTHMLTRKCLKNLKCTKTCADNKNRTLVAYLTTDLTHTHILCFHPIRTWNSLYFSFYIPL